MDDTSVLEPQDTMSRDDYVKNLVKENYKKYNIRIPYEKLKWSGENVEVELADGTIEIVDRLVEFTLCKLNSFYFIDRYCFTNHPKYGYVPFKLHDFQKHALEEFQKNSKVIFRKCLTDKNYVTTKRGYISIKNVKIGDEVQTLKDGKLVWTEVEDWWKNEELKEVVLIQTNNGSEIECTLDHKIHTHRGWIEAKDLTIEDEITSSFGHHPFGNFKLEYDEWAALIGYYLADGKYRDPVFVNTNEKYADEVLEAGKLFEGLDPYIVERKKEKYHHLQTYDVKLQGHDKGTPNTFNAFKKKYGLDKKSVDRVLTSELMNLNKHQMSIMLNRLFAGDGWFGVNNRTQNTSGKNTHKFEVGIGMPNLTFAKQIQYILLSKYGIYARIEEQFNGKKQLNRFWKIRINHRQSVLNFIDEIGIYDKTDGLDKVSILIEELASGYKSNQNHNKIKKIIRKKELKETYDITTKSSNFLSCIGLVHNCRQIGASVISGAYALWKANFYKKQTIKVISLTKDDAVEFKDKTIDLNYEKMPGFLKAKAKAGRMGRTKLELQNGSIIQVLPKSKNAGRGSTPSLVIIDEAAFNEWMDDIWKAVEPALDKGGDIIVISTTNGVGNWYHITYTRAEESLNEFHPIFIPWWRYPGRDNPWLGELLEKQRSGEWTEEYVQKFVKKKEAEQLSYKGNPKKGPWLWIRKANAKSEQEFNQEIMADFLGSGATVIPFDKIEKMEDECIKPNWKDVLPQDESNEIIPGLWVWRDRKPNSVYMLTVDTATGHGKDYSVMEIIDVYEREQVAEYKWQVPTDEMGRLVKKVASYYNNAYVVIECNHPGPATFNEVYKHKTDPYYNMYIKMKSGQPWSWDTTPKTRILLIEDFYKDLINEYTKVYSQRLVEEIKTFIWTEGGKPEAARNNNDDLIMAYSFYAHLVENVFSSRPAAIHTNQKAVDVDSMNAYDEDWEEKENFYKSTHGMTLIDYYWMQGWSLPDDYVKWKNTIRQEDIQAANQANRSVLEDNSMKNEMGFEKAPEWVKR